MSASIATPMTISVPPTPTPGGHPTPRTTVPPRVFIEHQRQENPYHTTYHLAKYQQYASSLRQRVERDLGYGVLVETNKRPPRGSLGEDGRGRARYPRLGSFEVVVEAGGEKVRRFCLAAGMNKCKGSFVDVLIKHLNNKK